VILARELGICYLNISLITDHDVGVEGEPGVNPVSHEEVLRVFAANNERLKHLLVEVVRRLPTGRCQTCQTS
jgi:5'-methylthioadenosine phosphorylase